ncbi:hypothetical protein BB561_003140 [Smittium simulii]|uniref:Uncharacterized protein n=1 Tax=Smittium simulii TaxID=133385 RepID=A0A2T9YMT2_9FUNG|nr:hypothetical protein BB561_003140 [Smittium simulii]
MPKVPGVIPSAAAGVPYHSAKRTRLEYSTVAKTDYIDPATKNNYNFNFSKQNSQKNDKISKNTKKFEKFQQNDKTNVKKITSPSYNPQKFIEVSVMHFLNDSKPKALKKVSYGGSNKKIGCSWTQFTGNIDAAIDHVALKGAEKCMNTPIYYNGKAVELYQTVTLEEGTQIITIPSTNSINIRMVVEALNNSFTKNRIIYDFSAYKNKKSGKFHTFGMKFLFKKTIDSFEIPAFLEIDKFVLVLTYRGCKPVCSFCKQQGHWNKISPKTDQNIVSLAPKSAIETTINILFINFKKKINQEVVKKNKEQREPNSKNEELISKKNIDRFIEFNSIKQPEESNLELLDQPIYADSSCASTPNFKKKHDMRYNDVLESLIDDILEWLNYKLGAHCLNLQQSGGAGINIKQVKSNGIVFTKNKFI